MTAPTRHPKFPLIPGIAGGLGPFAHVWLEQRLLALATQRFGAAGDRDFPEWIVSSIPQTPDRTAALLAGGDDPTPFLLRTLQRLRDAGADFAAIACNTAHAFLPRLADAGALPLPVVHAIVEAADFVRGMGVPPMFSGTPVSAVKSRAGRPCHVRRVGLLATAGTCRCGVFDAAFAIGGVAVIMPDETVQEDVMAAIYGRADSSGRRAGGIKAGLLDQPDAIGQSPRQMLRAAAGSLVRAGAQAVIVACSEISLAISPGDADVPIVDTMEVLADAVLDLAAGRRDLASLPAPDRWPRSAKPEAIKGT